MDISLQNYVTLCRIYDLCLAYRKWAAGATGSVFGPSFACRIRRQLAVFTCSKQLDNFNERKITLNVRYASDFMRVLSSTAYVKTSVVAA